MHLDMVISDIRGHTQVEGYSGYHFAINGYWVVDNLGNVRLIAQNIFELESKK